MHTTANYRLAEALPAPFFLPGAKLGAGAALTACLLTFLGMVLQLVRITVWRAA